jgi:ATP-dependent Clp protease ATP-binding subunit ClpB
MTSNIGSDLLEQSELDDTVRQKMEERLQLHFRPEFLNRIDETLIFHQLSKEDIVKIVDLQLHRFAARLSEQSITLELTEQAKNYIATIGYDPLFGARPVKRAIVKEVETPVSRLLISGELRIGTKLLIDVGESGLKFTTES